MKTILINTFFFFFLLNSISLNAQQTIQKSKTSIEKENVKEIENAIQDIKIENAIMKNELKRFTEIFSILGTLFGFLLLIGTFTSLYSWNTERKRTTNEYKYTLEERIKNEQKENLTYLRQEEAYQNFKSREIATSLREDANFEKSTKTLSLVNETLSLAKDASLRASKTLEDKLNRKHNELEQEAIELLEDSKVFKNYKILVEDSGHRSSLMTLALEISGLQNNQNILEKDEILNPYCSFIRGMEFHLNQHFKTAIKYWKQTNEHLKTPYNLRIISLYWIAYELNNLKDFENAASYFELASKKMAKDTPMFFELERMKIESKFFDKKTYKSEEIISEIDDLNKKIEKKNKTEEIVKIHSNVLSTIGNIYHQLGNENEGETSLKYYRLAKKSFQDATNKNKWIYFGFAEACFKLGEIEESEKCFLENVKTEAENEYLTRLEPRTKVLGQVTLLICSARIKNLNENVNTLHNLIKTTLGGVDERLTVYSQFQRRNVDKKEFISDLEMFVTNFNENKQKEKPNG